MKGGRVAKVLVSESQLIEPGQTIVELEMPGMPPLTADDTRRVASDLIASNKSAVSMLREQGYCDVSYALPGVARFRVNGQIVPSAFATKFVCLHNVQPRIGCKQPGTKQSQSKQAI